MLDLSDIPVIDVTALVSRGGDVPAVVAAIDQACRSAGFFYVLGHGIDPLLGDDLQRHARVFFAAPLEDKLRIRMELGGAAWRGYFPVGSELTAGRADLKEGLYFGAELDESDPRVRAGAPLCGPNLFPDLPGMRSAVLRYIEALTALGQTLVAGIGLALGLERNYFEQHYTAEPLPLLRIFNYPPGAAGACGVAEHTDYGLLTILLQDDTGGLQVKTRSGWIDAPPLPGSFVCNIGDMLDRATGGVYRSTPHRVRNSSERERLAIPFFFDPGLDAVVRPLALGEQRRDDAEERWDGASVHLFEGTYGDYLLSKVRRVFPGLGDEVL